MSSGGTLWTGWGGQGKGETAEGRIAGGKNSYMVGGRLPIEIQHGSAEKYYRGAWCITEER